MQKGIIIYPHLIYWLLLGLSIRLSYIIFVPQFPIDNDAGAYHQIAVELLQFGTYSINHEPTAYWSAGLPLFIFTVYKIFGINSLLIRFAFSILDVVSIYFLFLVINKAINYKTAMYTLCILALHPAFIGYCGLILPQIPIKALLTIILYLLMNTKSFTLIRSVLTGILMGYAILLRSEMFLLFTLVFIVLLSLRIFNYRTLIQIVFPLLLVMTPWIIRNYLEFGKPILTTIHYGDTMWISSWKDEWLEWKNEEPYTSIIKDKDPISQADTLFEEGINNILKYPVDYLIMSLKRVPRLWLSSHSNVFVLFKETYRYYYDNNQFIVLGIKCALLIFHIMLLSLGSLGFYLVNRDNLLRNRLVLISIIPIFYTVLHFFMFSTPRYSIPALSFLIIFSGYAIYVVINNCQIYFVHQNSL